MTDPIDHKEFMPRMTTSMKMLLMTCVILAGIGGGLYKLGDRLGTSNGNGKVTPKDDPNIVRVTPKDNIQKILNGLKEGQILVFSEGEYRQRAGERGGPPYKLLRKKGITLRSEKGVKLVGTEDPPLEIKDCTDCVLEGLDVAFENDKRNFDVLRIMDSKKITISACTLRTSRGDGVVMERSPQVTIERSSIEATGWGLMATGCSRMRVDDTEITKCTNQGGLLISKSREVELLGVRSIGNRVGLKTGEDSQITLAGSQLSGTGAYRGVVVVGGTEVIVKAGTRISKFDRAIEVEPNGILTVEELTLFRIGYFCIDIHRGAGRIKIDRLILKNGQKRPVRIEGDVQANWEINPAWLPPQ